MGEQEWKPITHSANSPDDAWIRRGPGTGLRCFRFPTTPLGKTFLAKMSGRGAEGNWNAWGDIKQSAQERNFEF